MKCIAQALPVFVLMIGLAASGTLLAAPQKVSEQKSKPVIQKVPKQTNKPVTAMAQNIYKQQSQLLRMQIKEDQKRLKADEKQYGKAHPNVKADRKQLQKNEKALQQLQKTSKKGFNK